MESSPVKSNLRMYVNDMLAVEHDLTNALNGQLADDNIKSEPDIHALLTEILADSIARADRLKTLSDGLDGQVGAVLKEAVSSAAGTVAGWYGMVRKHPVSRMLRDDHVALNVASLAYGMLYTSALAYDHQEIASATLSYMGTLPGQIMELSQLIPEVVVKELAEDYPQVDTSAIDVAKRAMLNVWMEAEASTAV
ncbi:MAG: hypothetical protein JWO08_885 [Verrucomicrobiaceae bacterium]|nr:hypothetical protein [Verrucomicrobiaceae bacterium]